MIAWPNHNIDCTILRIPSPSGHRRGWSSHDLSIVVCSYAFKDAILLAIKRRRVWILELTYRSDVLTAKGPLAQMLSSAWLVYKDSDVDVRGISLDLPLSPMLDTFYIAVLYEEHVT